MLQLGVVYAADQNANLNQTYKNVTTATVGCGNGYLTKIPSFIPKVIHIVYLVIQIVVPIVLVIFGTIDLVKAVIGGKDDEIKKNQITFVKRLIAAAIVFFVFVIVKFVISLVADDSADLINCVNCFINGLCGSE